MKENIREEFEREYPDLMHLPEGGMSIWLEESYMNGMVDWWIDKLNTTLKEIEEEMEKMKRTLEDGRPISDYAPDIKMMAGYNQALDDIKQLIHQKLIK